MLNYLATRPKLPNFVLQALITLFARISKLGWFDGEKEDYVFRNVVSDISQFLQVEYATVSSFTVLSEAVSFQLPIHFIQTFSPSIQNYFR